MKYGLAAAVSVTAGADSRAAGKQAKPNFLFILADDVTYNTLSCFGGRNIKTPNIDALAAEGMKFTRTYAAMSMCAPFRAELYTGLYPVRNGVARNHTVAKTGTKSVCHYLGDLNYRVGIAGKTHASPKTVFPFERVGGRDLAGDSVGKYMTKDPAQPFCLFCCSGNAHPPWRSGDASKIDSDKVKLPPVIHDNPPTRKTFIGYLAEVVELDREVGAILKLLKDSGQADNTLVMFSSEQGWDFAFGKWTNWDIGLRSALIARWPGKIKPGSVSDALVQIADITPTFIQAAGGAPEALKLDGRSFMPVLTGKTKTHRKYVYGIHNNVPEGNPYPIRSLRDDEFHYIANLKHDQPYHEKHLQNESLAKRYDLQWWSATTQAAEKGDKRAKMLMDKFHNRPAEELYRVDKDPYEMNNLAGDPKYADAKKRLKTELARWMAEQNDPGAAMDVPLPPKPKRKTRRKNSQ
jgi:N-sulfoglucosamine sulfohydrolase